MRSIALPLLVVLAAMAPQAFAQPVTLGFNGTGLSSATFNGFEFLDYGDLRLHSVIFANGSTGGTASTVVVNAVAQTQTRTYNWGTIIVGYAASGNRLTLAVTVNNQTAQPIRQIWFEPLGVRFPSSPSEFDLGYPLLRHSLGQVAAQSMTYSGGAMALISDDITKPVLLGFPYSNNGPFNTRFPITLNTDRVSSYASVYPTINRPIPAFGSDVFRFSLRFGGAGSTLATLGADVFQNFALTFPSIFNWTDRRPVAQLVLSTSNQAYATNPRGWFFDPLVDVTTPAGLANFRQRILAYATYSVPIIQSMNGQGAITWDVEGQQYPHPFSYVGDPRLLNTMAPEMATVADEYFAIFRNAGLRVGVTLRPQQFVLSPLQQNSISDPAVLLQMMVDKVNYARNRWNATLFYIDSNVNEFDPNPLDASLFRSLATMFPDVLFITEHSNMQYYASVAGYKELAQGFTSTAPEIRVAYPNAATFIYTPNADPAAYAGLLTTAFQQGDSFIFRGWYPDPANEALRLAYLTARPGIAVSVSPSIWALTPGASQQFSATVSGSANTGVTWQVVPNGTGSITPSGLYTAPASIGSPSVGVIVQAVSAADPTRSGIASVSVTQGVAVSVTPATATLTASQTQQFTATITGSANTAVTWNVSGAGSISPSGLYTAPASISSAQTVTVTATSVANILKSASASLTLSPGVSVNVSVAPPVATLSANQTQQFSATVTGSGNTAVTWGVTGGGTISSTGLYTAPASISPGQTAIVTATSLADATKSASASVTLSATVAVSVAPPSVTLSANQTRQFAATVTGSANTAVTWSVSGGGAVSATGLYTAPASIGIGQTATVTAASVADGSKSASASVTLSPTVAVSVTPPSATLMASQTQQFTATVTGSANTAVTWSLTGAGTLSPAGLYTAPASIGSPQTVTVTVTSVAETSKLATATVNLAVTPAGGGNGYSYRRTITIDHTRVPNTDQVNFPVLISGVYPSLATVANGGRVQSPSGFDIVFTADGAGANALNWEVESYNPATGAVAFWVKVPLVSHITDTTLYMFYGKSGVASFQGNRSGTWDSNYVAVYHLSDNAASTTVTDSSANANNGVAQSPTNAKAVAGRVQGALAFNGTNDAVAAASNSSLAITGNLTVEAWVNVNALPGLGNQTYIAGKGYNGSNEGYFLRFETNNSGTSFLQAGTFTFPSPFQAQVPVSGFAGQWRHVAGSYNGTWSVYVDGVRTASAQSVNPFATGEPLMLGARGATGSRVSFVNGALDEVRVSNIARSPDWIAASFSNQSNSAAFAILGTEQASGTPTVDVSVAPPSVTLTANQTQQFTATVTGSANTAVTWTLTGAGSLSATGLYTAPSTISSTTATVTATSVADAAKSVSASVTLSPGVAVSVAPPAPTLTANQAQQFTATVTGAANTAATWSLTGTGTLSATGLYTAPASITSIGTATVRVTSVADSTKFATATVTLSPSVGISVTPPSVTLSANQTQQFTATVTGSANTAVTWSLTGAGTLSAAGLYTAPASIGAPQTVTVTTTSVADGTKSASAAVTLSPPVAVTVAPLTATLSAGQTQQFTATVTGSANSAVTWTLAGSGTLSPTGLYTAPLSIVAPQASVVTATSVADPTKSAAANVSLVLAPITFTNGYGYRRAITIDHTRVPNTDQTNFPVLISGVYPSLASVANGGRVQSPSGFDIVFAADSAGTTALSWEVESYNPATGAVAFWVKVPLVSHTNDTVVYLFYGKGGITSFQGNRSGTWDSNYVAVYHSSDSAASTIVSDSTNNTNQGVAQSPTSSKAVAGRVQGALAFNGTNDSVNAGNASSLAITGHVTIEAWVNVIALPGLGNQAYIAGKGYNGSNEGYYLRLETNNSGTSFLQAGTYSFPIPYQAQVQLSGFAGQWRHVVGSYNGTWSVFVDGMRTGSTVTLGPLATGEPLLLGARDATGSRVSFLNGAMDEVRVSNVARSPDWITASFNSQSSPSSFFLLGAEQTSP